MGKSKTIFLSLLTLSRGPYRILLVFHYLPKYTNGALSGWSVSPTQYHVQTDEGPDRFFRYQTYNGQYRKERRMDDGTVIGSYGWVDPTGFLRMTDYIADTKGYRVVNSRMEYVGVKGESSTIKPELVSSESTNRQSTRAALRKYEEVVKTTPKTEEVTEIPTTETPVSNNKNEGRQKKVIKVYARRGTLSHLNGENLRNLTNLSSDEKILSKRPYVIQMIRRGSGKSDVFKSYATPLKRGNGFIYKIPNTQYHKEEIDEINGNRVGSFGYVDPFGIRRVIHYNVGKKGFEHEVDFKFVGKQDEEKN